MVRTVAVCVVLGGVVVLAGRAQGPDPEPPGGAAAELRKLKGTWAVTKAIFGGKEMKAPAGLIYTFEGDKLTRTMPFGKVNAVPKKAAARLSYKVKLDTRKQPYRITMTPEGGGLVVEGIYKIEKGELYLASARGKDRKPPADFKGDNVTVMVMTREAKK